MSLHRNRVQMTLSAPAGNPGTGTITLGSATAGYQSFASAYGGNATVDILITEGNNWEVCRNCAYTNSGTTVDRGTLEDSSAGVSTRVSFTSAAVVSVIATAATGNNWGLNEIEASPNANVTGVVGTMHILDISAFTASRDFTLPATCAVGDRVGVFIRTGDDAFELSLKPATGDTINGGSAGAEWSRLFIAGECVIFRCITANQDWIVEYDGRIPQAALLRLSTSVTTNTANTILLPTNTGGAWTADVNVGNIATTTNGRVTVRRNGNYAVVAAGISNSAVADQNHFGCGVFKNTESDVNNILVIGRFFMSGATALTIDYQNPTVCVPLVTTDYLVYFYRSQEANRGLASGTSLRTSFQVTEVL